MTCAWARKLGLLAAFPALLLGQRYSFKQYSQDEGLANLDVQCLMQDRTGFLWVATDGGVFRYDGRQFRQYTAAEGLPSMQVFALHQTADGVIWAGTTEGLARLNGEVFEKVAIDARGSIDITSDARGNLYVGSSSGLWVAEPAAGSLPRRFQLYTMEDARRALGIAVDSSGVAWYGCGNGICTFDNGRTTRLKGMGIPASTWEGLLFDTHGNLWARSTRLLVELPRGARKFEPRDQGLPFATRKAAVLMDRAGEIYVPTWQGLAHRTAHGFDLIRRTHGLPISAVDAFLEDREGSAWIALDGGGLVRWLGYKRWETFTESEGLNHDVVWGLTRDTSGMLWAATQAGVSGYLPLAHRWEALPHPLLNMTPNLALAADRDGTLWIAQAPGGVIHLNPHTGRTEQYGLAAGLGSDWVYGLALDAANNVWASTGRGLYRGSRTRAGFRFQELALPVKAPVQGIGSILADSRGWIWATTRTGLCYLADGQWHVLTARDGLRQDSVEYLAEAPDHAIWVAYRDLNSLSRLELFPGHRMSVRQIDPPIGGRPAKPYFLKFDRRGWLWMGTDVGLNRYDGKSWVHYDKADGMAGSDCDQNAFFEDDDGSIWVGTSRGLSHLLHPDAIRQPSPDVQPVLTSVALGGLGAPLGGNVCVPYARRSLDVAFAALTFVNEESASFRHRLLGLDDTWTETGHREAHYPGLAPGRYRLQVQAAPVAGVWSNGVAEVPFTIEAPWWRQWWARLGVLALLAALTRQIWRWRVRAMLRRQQELERAVADRTQKLAQEHDLALREKGRAENETQKVEKQKVEIERLLWESRQAERVKGEFVTNMSHEVRTPLNAIVGMTDLILQSRLDEDQAECLRVVKASSASLLALMNGVLDFSNVEGGKISLNCAEFDFPALVRETISSLEELARDKGLQLRTRFAPNFPPWLIGDAARVQQVLVNLAENAIKFTERGFVEVIVGAEAIAKDHAVMHVEVRDTGIGISAEQQALIFDPFRQADGSSSRRYGGAGLGLAMCSRLIALMDGKLWVESTPGAGSTFHFTARFGIAAKPIVQDAAAGSATSAPGLGLHILLVEDNLVNLKLARRLLENNGHTVTCAADGVQALDACDRSRFDAILMDVQMPVMDGFAATAELRKREKLLGRYTPVLALTANAMQGDRERCLSAGMDGYVTKPINTLELLQSIASALKTAALKTATH